MGRLAAARGPAGPDGSDAAVLRIPQTPTPRGQLPAQPRREETSAPPAAARGRETRPGTAPAQRGASYLTKQRVQGA